MDSTTKTVDQRENPYLESLRNKATNPLSAASSAESIQNRFLTMLVTELKNQDPLNPMDSKDMTAQLAQISTVQGIEKMNLALNNLSQASFASRILDATHLIGKQVSYSAQDIQYDGKTTVHGDISIPNTAHHVTVTVTDASGQTVYTQTIDKISKHMDITWDGKDNSGHSVPPGKYSIHVSTNIDNKDITTPFMMKRKVTGISQDSNGIILLFGNGEGIHLGDVDRFENTDN